LDISGIMIILLVYHGHKPIDHKTIIKLQLPNLIREKYNLDSITYTFLVRRGIKSYTHHCIWQCGRKFQRKVFSRVGGCTDHFYWGRRGGGRQNVLGEERSYMTYITTPVYIRVQRGRPDFISLQGFITSLQRHFQNVNKIKIIFHINLSYFPKFCQLFKLWSCRLHVRD
jgi:hypothetical protein